MKTIISIIPWVALLVLALVVFVFIHDYYTTTRYKKNLEKRKRTMHNNSTVGNEKDIVHMYFEDIDRTIPVKKNSM